MAMLAESRFLKGQRQFLIDLYAAVKAQVDAGKKPAEMKIELPHAGPVVVSRRAAPTCASRMSRRCIWKSRRTSRRARPGTSGSDGGEREQQSPRERTSLSRVRRACRAGRPCHWLCQWRNSGGHSVSDFRRPGGGELLAGALLVAYAIARRHRMPGGAQWAALLLLLVPQLCAVPLISPVCRHSVAAWNRLGHIAFLLSLAAPLWLALVAALRCWSRPKCRAWSSRLPLSEWERFAWSFRPMPTASPGIRSRCFSCCRCSALQP